MGKDFAVACVKNLVEAAFKVFRGEVDILLGSFTGNV
jgi:hypothetical protein